MGWQPFCFSWKLTWLRRPGPPRSPRVFFGSGAAELALQLCHAVVVVGTHLLHGPLSPEAMAQPRRQGRAERAAARGLGYAVHFHGE